MLIAKLRVSLNNVGIGYNSAAELGTSITRGATMADGAVVRGLGTHFADRSAYDRFQQLTRESNEIRAQFNRQFMKTCIDGTFIIPIRGQGKMFLEGLTKNPDIEVSVIEFELSSAGDGLDLEEMQEWANKIKNQLIRIPLGRGSDVDEEGLSSIEALVDCPVMARTTAKTIKDMVAQVRANTLSRKDFRDAIEKLNIELDSTALD
jgi:hypothetical protein